MTGDPRVASARLGIAAVLLVVTWLATGCSRSESTEAEVNPTFPSESFAVVANADVGTGPSRLLIGVLGQDGARLGSPDRPIGVAAAPMGDSDRGQQAPGVYTWIIEDAIGLYLADFDFDRAGAWAITVTPQHGNPLQPVPITVLEETYTPSVGEPALEAPTPTLRDHAIEDLTTDPDPDPRFYAMTLAEALRSGRPTVLIFSTPGYCITATCGPLLDTVKDHAPAYPDVNFIHIEVYTGFNEPGFAPDPAHLAPAAGPDHWNLPSEPWVFVIDEAGVVAARFEGVMTSSELTAALA